MKSNEEGLEKAKTEIMSFMRSIEERIHEKTQDVIYWTRRFERRKDDYSRMQLNKSNEILKDLKWKRDNPTIGYDEKSMNMKELMQQYINKLVEKVNTHELEEMFGEFKTAEMLVGTEEQKTIFKDIANSLHKVIDARVAGQKS